MASAIAFFSERDQILKIDAPVRARPVEGNLSLIEETHKKLPGDAEEIRGLLRGHLLGGGGERYRFTACEILDDLHKEPVELIRKRDLVESAMTLVAITFKTAPQFSDFRFLGVRNGGRFENRGHFSNRYNCNHHSVFEAVCHASATRDTGITNQQPPNAKSLLNKAVLELNRYRDGPVRHFCCSQGIAS
jgi:hypothetical protein